MKRVLPPAAALAFIAFFITIVIIADRGQGDRWWGFIHQIPHGDKVGHLGLIGTMSLLCNFTFSRGNPARLVTRTTLVLLVLLTLEEIAQAFIPSRTCDVFDWLADLAGLAVGQFAALRARAWLFPRQRTPRDPPAPIS